MKGSSASCRRMIKRQERISCALSGKTRGYEKSLKCQIKAGNFLERQGWRFVQPRLRCAGMLLISTRAFFPFIFISQQMSAYQKIQETCSFSVAFPVISLNGSVVSFARNAGVVSFQLRPHQKFFFPPLQSDNDAVRRRPRLGPDCAALRVTAAIRQQERSCGCLDGLGVRVMEGKKNLPNADEKRTHVHTYTHTHTRRAVGAPQLSSVLTCLVSPSNCSHSSVCVCVCMSVCSCVSFILSFKILILLAKGGQSGWSSQLQQKHLFLNSF